METHYCLKLLLSLAIATRLSSCCVFLRIDDGIIKGRIAPIPEQASRLFAFQQIPYAQPPVGGLRFQPPQPVTPWKGILDATKNTKICYQVGPNNDLENEDCLYLNVYTPQLPTIFNNKVSLPVMVFIYGGGFILGDATHRAYGPEFLVSKGVIIVTLNYRVGPFGFLSTQDRVIPGNMGLKDQHLALNWVKRNIKQFGGDPDSITIFGQSAGAASVGYHLLNPQSKGLFRAAIMESGSPLSPFSYQRKARHFGIRTASFIYPNVKENITNEELLQLMLRASAKDIDTASEQVVAEEFIDNAQLLQGYYYAPVIEPESNHSFITEKMFEIISRGDAIKVPIIMGVNSEEAISQTTDLVFLKRIMTGYDKYPEYLVPHDMNVQGNKTEVGEQIRHLYSGDDLLQNNPSAGIRYMSDTAFTRSVIKHASLQSKFSPVYFYQFSYDGVMGNVSIIIDGAERVGHNEENAYIWRIVSDLFNNYDRTIYPNADIVTQNRLLTLWTNFAKTLNPTPFQDELLQNLKWPLVASSRDFPYLDIGLNLEIKNQPKQETYDGWSEIYKKYGTEPYDTF